MSRFKIEIGWSGYSRGITIYEVEAEDEEHASEIWDEGEKTSHYVVRDDTEKDILKITEIKED